MTIYDVMSASPYLSAFVIIVIVWGIVWIVYLFVVLIRGWEPKVCPECDELYEEVEQ